MKIRNTRRGFTLMELLVVVLIIGILAAVAVPQYQKAVMKSRYATLKVLTKAMAEAEEIYYLANNQYTTKLDELDISIPPGDTPSGKEHENIYTWGKCWLSPSQPIVRCHNEQINMDYQYYLKHSTDIHRGKYACIALNGDLTSAQNKICQQETGKETPYYKDTTSAAWAY